MGSYQLPKIKNEDQFEDLSLDLFNLMESTNTFKRFGRKGHNQKGIDVFSSEKDIVVQCKKKDLTRKEILIRKELMNDIETDIQKIISQNLKIKFEKIYFLSTYKDHPDIDEFCDSFKEDNELKFEIIYWGWDTLEAKIVGFEELIKKYYPNFIFQNKSSKESQLLRNLQLKKKIEKDFALWLNYNPEDRTRNSKMILRAFDKSEYPYSNRKDEYGEYSWFGAEIHRLYYNGLEFIYRIDGLIVFEDYKWKFEEKIKPNGKYREVTVARIGQINFSDIVAYDVDGDEHYNSPHFFCKFKYNGLPFENIYFESIDGGVPEYFEFKDMLK